MEQKSNFYIEVIAYLESNTYLSAALWAAQGKRMGTRADRLGRRLPRGSESNPVEGCCPSNTPTTDQFRHPCPSSIYRLPPSTNALWRSNRGRVHRSKEYDSWRTTAGWELKAQRPGRAFDRPPGDPGRRLGRRCADAMGHVGPSRPRHHQTWPSGFATGGGPLGGAG